MGSVGAPEILVILVVALLVLGPDRLPDAARQAGRVLSELRRMSSGFQAELRDAMTTPVAGPPAPPNDADTPASATEVPPEHATEQRFLWSDLPASGPEKSS
jgi:TatA/E family protein of Tat protein translocase